MNVVRLILTTHWVHWSITHALYVCAVIALWFLHCFKHNYIHSSSSWLVNSHVNTQIGWTIVFSQLHGMPFSVEPLFLWLYYSVDIFNAPIRKMLFWKWHFNKLNYANTTHSLHMYVPHIRWWYAYVPYAYYMQMFAWMRSFRPYVVSSHYTAKYNGYFGARFEHAVNHPKANA